MIAIRSLSRAALILPLGLLSLAMPAAAQFNPAPPPPHAAHPKATPESIAGGKAIFAEYLRRMSRCGRQRVERPEYSRRGRADGARRRVREDSRRRNRIGDVGVYDAGRRNGLEDRGLRDDAGPRRQGRGHRRSTKRHGDLPSRADARRATRSVDGQAATSARTCQPHRRTAVDRLAGGHAERSRQ